MKKRKRLDPGSLKDLIDELTAEAGSDDEQIRNFQQALHEHIWLPCEGFVIAEPVTVLAFDYDGNQRRAVTARCRRADGGEYELAASELVIPASLPGADYLAAYRQWMGLEPYPPAESPAHDTRWPAGAAASIELRGPVELVVLSVKQKAACCRPLGGDRTFTLRAGRLWDVVPGEIAVVRPRKQWTYAGGTYLSGVIESTRIEASALGLVPLKLEDRGTWNPSEHYWGEEEDPIEEWANYCPGSSAGVRDGAGAARRGS